MNNGMNEILETIALISPNKYMQAMLIALIFLIAAKIMDVVVIRFVKNLFGKTKTSLDDRFIDIFHKPIFMSVALFGLVLAVNRIGFPHTVHFTTVAGLKTIAIFLWSTALGRFLRIIVERMSRDTRFNLIQERTLPLFYNIVILTVTAGGLYFTLLAWNIDVTAWMASAGILGLAISFAAKDTLSNLVSGVFIMADTPYKIGDMIVLDSGERGEVTDIGIRSTRIITRDDVEIILPNAVMGTAKITNEAGGPSEKYRVRIKVGVAYGCDVEQAMAALVKTALANPEVCPSPEPRARFRSFGDSSLDLELLCWVEKPVLRGRIVSELNTEVYKNLMKENIEIPFPQRDVHIKTQPL